MTAQPSHQPKLRQNYINGIWGMAQLSQTFESRNPSDWREAIATYYAGEGRRLFGQTTILSDCLEAL